MEFPAREHWQLDPEVAFLNHGSFGACPTVVLAAQQRLRDAMERQPVDFLMAAQDAASAAVAAPARLLGVRPQDLAFVDNATNAVNAVLRSFDLKPGDAVITTTHAYGAVQHALRYVCDRAGARLIEVPIAFPTDGADAILASWVAALDRADGVKLAVVDHITSKTGLVLPIRELVARCAERAIPVLVDGAHAPGHLPLDLEAIGADWYTGNLHKWAFAPKGCAVLHVTESRQASTRPLTISHGYGGGLHAEFHWVGTKDPTPWLCAPDAIGFLEACGPQRLRDHNDGLADRAANLLAQAWNTRRPAPAALCGALVTLQLPFDLPSTDAAALVLHDRLRARGIEVPCFPFQDRVWLRISAQAYNELAEYELLAQAVLEIGRTL